MLPRSTRLRVSSILLVGLSVVLALSACALQHRSQRAPLTKHAKVTRPVVPEQVVQLLAGRDVASAVASSPPYAVGAATDRVSVSVGESITVVGWIASTSSRSSLIDDNGFGPGFMNLVVVDQGGRTGFDSAKAPHPRFGPLLVVPLAAGHPVTQPFRFSLDRPGRYTAIVSAGFRAQKPDAANREGMTPESTIVHAATAPGLSLTVR